LPTDKELIAFKIGARARKFLNEECPIEGYEILYTAIEEAKGDSDGVMLNLLQRELEKYEKRVAEADI
jgi:hypothetical protein